MMKFSVLNEVLVGCKADSVAECTDVNEVTYAYLWNEVQKTESGNVYILPVWDKIPKDIQRDIFKSLAKPITVSLYEHDISNRVKLVKYIDEDLDFTFGYIVKVERAGFIETYEYPDEGSAKIQYFKVQKQIQTLANLNLV